MAEETPGTIDDPAIGIPPDAGRRASVDKSGQVHGSGSGTGGGNPGEDFDSDAGGDESSTTVNGQPTVELTPDA